jgi:diadenosine tetraphosphate (Ap4A) HIT family hydrolase
LEASCDICSGKADDIFKRVEVWKNPRWRLTMSTLRAAKGFCYLEPNRHIRFITELNGREADEFGRTLAVATKALKDATGSKLVYVYIFGDHIPHLHVHLAPHVEGDIYVDDVIKNDAKVDEATMEPAEFAPLADTIGKSMSRM